MSTPEATRKACDALYRAMGELDTFEDRPDLASPTTRGAFEDCYEMLAELAVAKGLIKLPIRTQRSESPTNEDRSTEGDEGSDEPAPRKERNKSDKLQAKADRARKLTATFLQKQGGSPLQPGNIQILLCNPPSGPRKKQEADAVERLLCGIEWAEEEVWKPLFDGITAEIPNILANHQDRSEECDREVNRLNRLLKRHEVLNSSASQETAHHIVQMVLSKIDMVRFAEDFDILTQTEKSNFLDQAYIQQHPVDFRGLGQQAQKHMLDADRAVVNAWKKQIGRVTTARNRLRALFLQYGAMVILDPVWNTKTLLNHQGHELHMVLMSLPSKLVGLRSTDPPDSPHPLAILQPSVEHALVCIVEALAGIAAATYVNEFLDEYALQMRIPRDPRYD